MPLVSFAILENGKKSQLPRLLNGIANQEHIDFKSEIVVGTREQVMLPEGDYEAYVFPKSIKSKGAAYNYLLSNSRGKFVVPMEADWQIHPQFLAATIVPLRFHHIVAASPMVKVGKATLLPPEILDSKTLISEMFHPVFVTSREAWAGVGGFKDEFGPFYFWDFFVRIFGMGLPYTPVNMEIAAITESSVPKTIIYHPRLREIAFQHHFSIFAENNEFSDEEREKLKNLLWRINK